MIRKFFLIIVMVCLIALITACTSENAVFTGEYGYLNKEDNQISLLIIESNKGKVEGTYRSFQMGDEGIDEVNESFTGKLSNDRITDLDLKVTSSATVTEHAIEIETNQGKKLVFKSINEAEFEAALASLETSIAVMADEEKEPVDVPEQEKTEEITDEQQKEIMTELVALTDQLDTIRRQVIDTIEANGWYEAMEEIEPSTQKFEEAVRPIVSPYFTDSFITTEIIDKMEAFFCYCDAPSPLQGSMKPDVLETIEQSSNEVSFVAYRPANEVNSGGKFNVTAVKEEGAWKVDSWNLVLSSYEQSFELTVEQVMEYYKFKGTEVEHIDTLKDTEHREEVYVFKNATDGEMIAIQSRDWFTAEGIEWIEQLYE